MHPVGAGQVGERAAIAILALLAEFVLDRFSLDLTAGEARRGVVTAPTLLGGVDADEAGLAEAGKLDRVPVDHPLHADRRRGAGSLAFTTARQ